jgi:hypothetical protein
MLLNPIKIGCYAVCYSKIGCYAVCYSKIAQFLTFYFCVNVTKTNLLHII